MTARPAGVSVVSVQRQGGGQEQCAAVLSRELAARCREPVQLVALREDLHAMGGLARALAALIAARKVSFLHLLFPLLWGRLRYRTVVLYQGLAFLHIPLLRLLGHRVVAMCDAPQRPARGWSGLRERTMPALVRHASVVVRTYDFAAPYPPGPVLPDILEPFPATPAAFAAAPVRRLLYVARLQPEKGLADFLRLAGEMPEFEFVIFGAGELEPEARAAAARLANIDYRGYSRSWRDEAAGGACLVGCCRTEGSWTTGKEALLAGLPLIWVPSVTGAPTRYRGYTDKAVEVATLTRSLVLDAIVRIDAAKAADPGPVWTLWRENRPQTLAEAFAAICGLTVDGAAAGEAT